jgi:hypothetical protein
VVSLQPASKQACILTFNFCLSLLQSKTPCW